VRRDALPTRPSVATSRGGSRPTTGAATITIHLTEADPDFPGKLTSLLASVVPAGTPLRVASKRPIPGTGPYRVARFEPARAVRLVRNPYFRLWSQDARPDGYPDVIRFHLSDDAEAGLVAVEKGRADWVNVGTSVLSAARMQGVLTRHPRQLHSDPYPFSFWMFLNTRVPPFDDVRVRRALNYARDWNAIRRFGGSTLRSHNSCQILTPGLPGYRPYCPYTLNSNPAGTWIGPDPARARALIAASDTRGMRVEVATFESDRPAPLKLARYWVALLRKLGYRSSLRVLPDFGAYVAYIADSRNRAQLGPYGYVADILAPAFLLRLFSCEAFLPGTPANENPSEFCDRRIDRQMRRATALQASDPARANELWADVDRALTDRAVAVFTSSMRNVVFVSERVGNYQSHPQSGTLLDQLWVK